MGTPNTVSSTSDVQKERLLKERREKLLKWREKRAQLNSLKRQHPESKESSLKEQGPEETQENLKHITNKSNVETTVGNDTNGSDIFAERRRRLEAWKRIRRSKEQGVEAQVEPGEYKSLAKKPRKNGSKRITFGNDTEETDKDTNSLFILRAGTDFNDATLNETTNLKQGSIRSTDEEPLAETTAADPLDALMEDLERNGTSSQSRRETQLQEIFDEDSDSGLPTQKLDATDEDKELLLRYQKIAKMKLLKKVTEIDFTKEKLVPFQKNLYHEAEEIRDMSPDEVVELRFNLDNIKIRGHRCPNPVLRWSQLGLDTTVMDIIVNKLKYQQLTPIQAQALPAIMSGRDVIGISKTGSGKTMAYLLPLMRQVKAQRDIKTDEVMGPLALILAPTRELAVQIHEEVLKFTAGNKNLTSICCTGGSELKRQIDDIKRGVKIIVATPGRFIDILTLNSGRLVSTKRITFVVMDEADRLFDMGFEPQITQIMKAIRPDKQCVLFSATFPQKLRNFATRVLKSPLTITVHSANLVNENIIQRFILCNSVADKFNNLMRLLETLDFRRQSRTDIDKDTYVQEEEEGEEGNNKTIIFVAGQQICDLVDRELSEAGFEHFTIHAGKPYHERVLNLENFRKRNNSILLCTEVLSRGLNVPEVSTVIIYNAIKTFAQYIHTTGRTARGNRHGEAITLLENDELAAAYILKRSMTKEQLAECDPLQVVQLGQMSDEFEAGLRKGNYKLSSGFGGRGLDHLDSKREEQELKEKKHYEAINGDSIATSKKGSKPSIGSVAGGKHAGSISAENHNKDGIPNLPKLKYDILREANPDGTIAFCAHVYINDLPQAVRWEATKNTTLTFVKHETGCSITNKGRYYPEGQGPKTPSDEPKLFLLIEGKEEKDLHLSIELLQQHVEAAIRKMEHQTLKGTKF